VVYLSMVSVASNKEMSTSQAAYIRSVYVLLDYGMLYFLPRYYRSN